MSAQVTLTALEGPLAGKVYTFDARTRCLVGRDPDCTILLQGESRDLTASRRHCLLEIDPPEVRVRDLGSLNGTYVNGLRLATLEVDAPTSGLLAPLVERPLRDGDQLQVGCSLFLVQVAWEVNLEDGPEMPDALTLEAPGESLRSAAQRSRHDPLCCGA